MRPEGANSPGASQRDELYTAAIRDFGSALDRLATGYEADPDKRHDLRQEIHLQLWRSLAVYDARCSLKTWVFRVAHNAAVSYVNRERRFHQRFVALEDLEHTPGTHLESDIDRARALQQLWLLIRSLKPLDRQIMISYLEEMDTASIADITGLSIANVAMKIHRIKNLLSRRFHREHSHV